MKWHAENAVFFLISLPPHKSCQLQLSYGANLQTVLAMSTVQNMNKKINVHDSTLHYYEGPHITYERNYQYTSASVHQCTQCNQEALQSTCTDLAQ